MARALLALVCSFLAGCPSGPGRGGNFVKGSLAGARGGAPFAATFDFGVLQPGSVVLQPSAPIDLSAAGLLPLPFTITAAGAGEPLPSPGLGLGNLPPNLVWAGPWNLVPNEVELAFARSESDVTVWGPSASSPPVLTFDGVTLTDDPQVPLLVSGRLAGALEDPEGNTYAFRDTTFQLSADCGPNAAAAPRLCGDAPGSGQFLGFGSLDTCPAALDAYFVGDTTDAKYDGATFTLRIGQGVATFDCREVWTPEEDAVKRRLCTASVEDFAADGCTWRAFAVAEPRARFVTISAWADPACATPVCNALR
jgi:hypothetical protein